MNKETHLYLADRIYHSVIPEFSVEMHLDNFLEANIRPDQTYQSVLHPHFASWSLEYIRNQTVYLSQQILHDGENIPMDFTFSLGRITHYLCDFFCQAHFGKQLFRVREHIEYETELQRSIVTNRPFYDDICQETTVHSVFPATNIKQIYAQNLRTYQQLPAGFARDMRMATRVSVQVTYNVIYQCLRNNTISNARLRCAHSF